MDLTGNIKAIRELQHFNNFVKQEIVITTQEQYPQDILIEFHQNNVDLISNVKVGDEVKVSINLRGREWINADGVAKYFNSIVGWKIQAQNSQSVNPNQYNGNTQPGGNINEYSNSDEPDDLPF